MSPTEAIVSKQTTALELVCAKLDWKISQFDKLMRLSRLGQDLVSDHFSVPQAKDIVWELHIYPKGKREEDANNVSLFLRQVGMKSTSEPIMTEFRVYCVCPPPMPIYNVCRDNKEFVHQQGRGKFKITYDRISQAIHEDGTLHVVCEVEFVPPGSMWKALADSSSTAGTSGANAHGQQQSTTVNLRPLFDTGMLSDSVIKIGNDQLNCHRCVLGLNSVVFRQMFEHSTTSEARTGVIEMPDTTVPAARAMLEFMYTGAVTQLDRHATDLLALAEKYGIAKLKELCETALCATISITNACQLLIFADTYMAQRVRDAAIKFISENHAQILDTAEWKSVKDSNPTLASDILEVVLGGCGTRRSLSVSYSSSPMPSTSSMCVASTSYSSSTSSFVAVGASSSASASSSFSPTDTGCDEAGDVKPPPKKRTRQTRK